MAVNLETMLLVSCRHCLRPIRLATEIDDLELTALRAHLRGCADEAPFDPEPAAADVLAHYRVGPC
jgi:hypothetical protein